MSLSYLDLGNFLPQFPWLSAALVLSQLFLYHEFPELLLLTSKVLGVYSKGYLIYLSVYRCSPSFDLVSQLQYSCVGVVQSTGDWQLSLAISSVFSPNHCIFHLQYFFFSKTFSFFFFFSLLALSSVFSFLLWVLNLFPCFLHQLICTPLWVTVHFHKEALDFFSWHLHLFQHLWTQLLKSYDLLNELCGFAFLCFGVVICISIGVDI